MKPNLIRSIELILVIILSQCLVGCKTTDSIDWDSRVGSYTYDQAVLDLGPPDRESTLTDGTRVSEWIRTRGSAHTSYHFAPGGLATESSSIRSPDRSIQLTFDAPGKLKNWKMIWR